MIGWPLPVNEMCAAVPTAMSQLQADSALPLASGIMTTDLYPKLRSVELAGGRIVAVAKGRGDRAEYGYHAGLYFNRSRSVAARA